MDQLFSMFTKRQMNSSQTTKYNVTIKLDSQIITRPIFRNWYDAANDLIMLIDLQKDFEAVNHKTLFKKFESIGFSEQCTR